LTTPKAVQPLPEQRTHAEQVALLDFDFAQLSQWLAQFQAPPFRARQIWEWIYQRYAEDFAAMSDLPKTLREQLAAAATLTPLAPVAQIVSSDRDTVKVLFELADGQTIEAVLMLYDQRRTLCISSQAGCAMGCTFCATAQGGLARNLTSGEIVAQVLYFARLLANPALPLPCSAERPTQVTNLVLMGMGEPLHNYDATMRALGLLAAPQGLAMTARRVTLSTVGLVPMLDRLATEPFMPNLAISLHATTEAQRAAIVPPTKKYSLAEILEACRRFPVGRRNRITFEYVMLAGVNDSPDDARRLARLLEGIRGKVNLIPLNEAAGIPFDRPSDTRVSTFAGILADRGVVVSVRKSRGRDIRAACGQLIVEGHERRSPAQRLSEAMTS